MNILDQIEQDLIKATKEKKETTLSVLRMLKASMKNKEIELGKKLDDEEVLTTINKEAKKRKEAAEAFLEGGRPELADKEKEEYEILEAYLPKKLSEEEIKHIVQQTITEMKADSVADAGKVIGAVIKKIKNQAEGSTISKIVKEELSK